MPIAKYTTTIAADKTAADIQRMLAKAGARSMMLEYDPHGQPSSLSFMIRTEYGERAFVLPVRTEGVLATLKRDKVEKRYQTPEHAAKVAWRVAHTWLTAQLAIIDAGVTTLDEVMFPWMLTGGGAEGAYQVWVSKQKAIEA